MSTQKLSICILGTAHPYKGGIAAFNERMALELISHGHDVEIINFKLQYPSFLYPGKSQYSNSPQPKDLKILRKINSVNPITWLKTGKYIKKKSFDLIITRFWLPVMGLSMGVSINQGKVAGYPIVISIIDNLTPHETRIGDKLFTKVFINALDGALTMSHSVLDELTLKFPALKTAYNPHPIYDIYGTKIERSKALNKLKLDPSRQYILFFGFIRAYKGLDWLLEAFALIKDELPQLEIIVAGEFYQDDKEYIDLIEQLNIQGRVHLYNDFIPDDEVNLFFSSSDLVAQTYKSATQSGISQIAIHFEKPLLSTKVGGLKETTFEGINGVLVNDNIHSIKDGILNYFNDPSKYYNPDQYPSIKKKFLWGTLIDRIFHLYDEIKSDKQ